MKLYIDAEGDSIGAIIISHGDPRVQIGWKHCAKRLSSRPAATGGNPEKYTVRIEPDQLGSDVRSRNAVALSIGNDRAVIIENEAADRRSSQVAASFLRAGTDAMASDRNIIARQHRRSLLSRRRAEVSREVQ